MSIKTNDHQRFPSPAGIAGRYEILCPQDGTRLTLRETPDQRVRVFVGSTINELSEEASPRARRSSTPSVRSVRWHGDPQSATLIGRAAQSAKAARSSPDAGTEEATMNVKRGGGP
jgi:hypothetical protein